MKAVNLMDYHVPAKNALRVRKTSYCKTDPDTGGGIRMYDTRLCNMSIKLDLSSRNPYENKGKFI